MSEHQLLADPRCVKVQGTWDYLLTVDEAAESLGVSPWTLRDILRDPTNPLVGLRVVKKHQHILKSSLSAYVEWVLARSYVSATPSHHPQSDEGNRRRVIPAPKQRGKRKIA